MPVEMAVDSVRIDLLAKHRFVVLKEVERERYLPIAIGPAEAGAIAIKLMNAEVVRPLTHDLICSVIASLGGTVTKILITNVSDGVYYARVVLDVDGRHVEVDSRPSDAIALAVRTNVPIYVAEHVLEHAVVDLSDQGTQSAGPAGASGASAGGAAHQPTHPEFNTEERVPEEQLAAFRDVIERLNLDDLGKT
jgi:bifunctional DNase/RNase